MSARIGIALSATPKPLTKIVTLANGQSPNTNWKLSHAITGHIIDPASMWETAHRIPVCARASVDAR